jgi:hypothetical protein
MPEFAARYKRYPLNNHSRSIPGRGGASCSVSCGGILILSRHD